MYASAAPAAGLAAVDVPHDGRLVGIDWAMHVAAPAADFAVVVQLSFGSAEQASINDTRSVISDAVIAGDLNTSGFGLLSVNKYVALPGIQVGMGERIYLHAVGSAITTNIRCCLFFDFELDRALARRR
jgi:hypothetical protein